MGDPFSQIPPDGRRLGDRSPKDETDYLLHSPANAKRLKESISELERFELTPAAFSATVIDVKLIRTRHVVQILLEEDVTRLPVNLIGENGILGSHAELAAGKVKCGIARLNIGGAALDHRSTTLPDDNASLHGSSAPGLVTKTSPGRSPSQEAFLLCNQPRGRVFLEQRRRHAIPANNQINNTDEAKHVLRAWLEVDSLSELDRDTKAADRWERIEADFKTWLTAARYVEAP